MIGTLFALLLSEVALNICNFNYVPIKIQMLKDQENIQDKSEKLFIDDINIRDLGQTDWRHFHQVNSEYLIYDSELIWKPKSNFEMFNKYGYIGPPVRSSKNGSEIRILALGDSNTAGDFMKISWPDILGHIFKKNKYEINIINAGVWGYTSYQGVLRFKEMLKHKPDIVMISFGSNDAHMVPISDKNYIKSKDFYKNVIEDFKLGELSSFIHDSLTLRNKGINLLIPRVSEDDYKNNLKSMINIAEQNRIKVVLLTRPFIGESDHELWWKNFGPQYNEIVRETAKNENILLIDIYEYFKNKELLFADEAHFTDEGHILAAEYIYKKIINSSILKDIQQNSMNNN